MSGETSDRVVSEMTSRGIKLSAKRFKRLKGRENIGNNILVGSALPKLKPFPEKESIDVEPGIVVAETAPEDIPSIPETETTITQQIEDKHGHQPSEIVPEELTVSEPVTNEESFATEPVAQVEVEEIEEPAVLEAKEQAPETKPVEINPSLEKELVTDPVEIEATMPVTEEETLQETVEIQQQLQEPSSNSMLAKTAKKTTRPGCWHHPKLGYFQFKQKGKFVELTHETPNKDKTRVFSLKDEGGRLIWSTHNVIHEFVRDLQGMRLFLNVEKGGNEAKLERCTE